MSKDSTAKSSTASAKKSDKSDKKQSGKSTDIGENNNKTAEKGNETANATDTGGGEKSGSGATAKGGTTSRPISYFSSVATDEYRAGWANIFGKNGVKKEPSGSAQLEKPSKKEQPTRVMIHDGDLTEEIQSLLRDALKKKARKEKLGIGRQLSKAEVSWSIECRIKY